MKRIFNEELDRAFRNPRFFIIFALALAIFFIGNYRLPLLAISADISLHPVNRLIANLHYGEFGFLAALLATLPFADSFLDDLNQGFLRLIVQRVPYRKYLTAKALAVGLAGGLSLLLAVLVIFLAGLSGLHDWKPMDNSSGNAFYIGEPQGPLGGLYTTNPMLYLLYLLASAFGFGAVYALMGLAISAIIHNRYVVLAAPLVFVQVLKFMEERSLHLTPALNPLNGLLPFGANFYDGNFTLGAQLAQFGFVLVISVLGFFILTRKSRTTL
jgi:hypothetical protein